MDIDVSHFKDIVNHEQPFGPAAAEAITNEVASAKFFRSEYLVHMKGSGGQPSVVVGRRGSGKTAYLRSKDTHGGAISLELNTGQAFASVQQVARAWKSAGFYYFLDHLKNLWDASIWNAVLAQLVRSNDLEILSAGERKSIEKYLKSLTGRERPTPMEAFSMFCGRGRENATTNQEHFKNYPFGYIASGERLSDVVEKAKGLLNRINREFLVLLDSMEDFERVVDSEASAFEALLALVGSQGRASAAYRLRLAIPSELYKIAVKISSNEAKDFDKEMFLEWSARELVAIAAHRFLVYTATWYPEIYRRDVIGKYNVNDPDDVKQIFKDALPAVVTNSLGGTESALPYILRHTQLLPRHMILLLNDIWKRRSSNESPFGITPQMVIEGVRNRESTLAREICRAYNSLYPNSLDIYRNLIPQLSMKFTEDELYAKFPMYAKRVSGDVRREDARIMMIEMGAVGRLVGQTETYIEAEFDYNTPRDLAIGHEEIHCLHPLFAGAFSCMETRPNRKSGTKPIYPRGWNPEFETN